MTAIRGIAAIGVLATVGVALVYVLSVAGLPVPTGVLVAVAVPPLFITAAAYIVVSRAAGSADVPGFRWWMPVVWVALIINDGVVWSLADRATQGGHVERVGSRAILVAHGRTLRDLDPSGVRAVALWDTRQISGHLLVMLGVASLGLVAMLGPRREAGTPPPAP